MLCPCSTAPRSNRRRATSASVYIRPRSSRTGVIALWRRSHARSVSIPIPVSRETVRRWLRAAGQDPVPAYQAADLAKMLDEERVDQLVVTSVDSTHAGHIVTALQAGCDVITEKPMTVDAQS